jgi:hypothetical protein
MQQSAVAVWSVSGSANPITPGQILQSVRFDGQHSYIVDVGGPLKTRKCVAQGGAGIAPSGIGGFGTLGTAVGTGNGASIGVPVDVHTLGILSEYYNNDTLFVGVKASTDAADSFYGGLYHFEALNWTLYFGKPPPAPGQPAGHFDNPIGNTNPGKIAGTQQFDAVKFTLDQPYVNYCSWQWRLPRKSGVSLMTFASTGTNLLTQAMGGMQHTPGNINNTGLINIDPATLPGTYNIEITVTFGGTDAGLPTLVMTTPLVVRTTGGMFMEA